MNQESLKKMTKNDKVYFVSGWNLVYASVTEVGETASRVVFEQSVYKALPLEFSKQESDVINNGKLYSTAVDALNAEILRLTELGRESARYSYGIAYVSDDDMSVDYFFDDDSNPYYYEDKIDWFKKELRSWTK